MPAWVWPVVLLALPPLSGRVVDQAALLSPEQELALAQDLERLERDTSVQVVIATLPSLEGQPIEDVALRMALGWELGQRGLDNGALVLVARAERKVRIEVGYGLEAAIPDALANRIIEERVVPRFRASDFAGGLRAALEGLSLAARQEYPQAPPQRATSRSDLGGILGTLVGCAVFWFVSFGILWDPFGLKHPLVPASLTAIVTFAFLALVGWASAGVVLVALPAAFGLGWLLAPFGHGMDRISRTSSGGTWRSDGYSSGGYSSGGGSFSDHFSGSSGGDFSGGGGSFGGGGASGSW